MAAPQPPPANLKDRIAALQQRNGTPSPTASPTFPSRDASVTPPRGSLRDKIAKFEKRGGVPIPRGSFGMGVPPLEDTGSTKSRELYGNRVAALGKGRPTAPGNSGNRAVTSPSINLAATSNRTSPDANAAIPTANVAPNLISHSISLSTPLSRHTSSGLADRPASALGVVDKSDEAQQTPTEPADQRQETLVQRGPIAQPESSSNTQDAMPSEPIDSAAKSTSEPSLSSASSVHSPSTGSTTTAMTRRQSSSIPLKVTLSKVASSQARSIAPSLTPSCSQSTPATPAPQSQEGPPAVTPKHSPSTVQAHVTVEQFPVKEAAINATSRGSRLDHPLTVTSARSDAPSVEDGLKRRSTPTPTPTANKAKTSVLSDSTSTPAPSVGVPANKSSAVSFVSGDLEPSAGMAPSTIEPGRPNFSAVVHRGDDDVRPDSAQGAPSRSSIATSRPSSSSFKPGTDGGVVRSKRNFKHLGALPSDPPMSPVGGDLGAGELAALLQEAAWLEQRLSDENMTFDISSVTGEEPKAAMESAVSPATIAKGGQVATSAHAVATSTRTKGRGLTLDSSTSALPTNTLHSPIRSSPSTPSFQVHPAASNLSGETPPKSARPRKYFSLRGALRGQRLSMSSEMSSDDSAPVATPPSPNFELSMAQAAHGHGNDTMSIRSMFSIRSNRSGKSDSVPGSLRLSPRRSVSRASSFAERLFNRAMRSKSMLDDPDDAIPEQSPMLPPITSETPSSLLSISPMSASSKNEVPFDRDIFDSFPNVPSEIPQGPASYLFPVPPKAVEQDFKRSSIIKVSTSENGGSQDTPTWLR